MSERIHPGPHPDADQLNAFMEGLLPEHERLESLAHLAECSRCRELVFLAQEPSPVPVAAKAVPPWRSWFGGIPVFAAAFAGLLLVAAFLYWHRAARAPNPVEVAKVEPVQPLPVPEPAPQSPLEQKAVPQRQTEKPATAAPPSRSAPAPEGQPVAGKMAGASSFHGAVPGLLPQSQGGAGSGQNYSQFSQMGNGNQVVTQSKNVSTLDGPLPAPAAQADARGAAVAAAPPLLQDQVIDNARIENLPINGRAVSRAPASPVAASAPPVVGGPVRLRIEHNYGPAGGLSQVTGTVVDPTGAVVPGATVMLRRLVEAVSNKVTTDKAGRFTLAAVPPGQYEVQIAAQGFLTLSQQIELQPRDLAQLTPVLSIGAMSETVTVDASAAEVDTELGTVSQTVKKREREGGQPGKLPIVTSMTIGDRTLSLDAEGVLFFSKDGKHWHKVKPVWQGQVSQLALLPSPPSQAQGAISATAGLAGSTGFQLTTAAHVIWVSEDGVHWRQQ
jgi:hypothetical protein